MTVTIIISFCILLLIAYVFDLTSSKSKVPSAILLLLMGWGGQQFTTWFGIKLPDMSEVLPVIGTVGLILIVLEGSLELELNRSKISLIKKSFFGALLTIFGLAFLLAFAFNYFGHYNFKDSLTNAIPFCVISSAIAIPSVSNLTRRNKEFVIYESSFSDILGVLIFNFLALNVVINASAFGAFGLQLLIIIIVSLVATIGLSYLMNKIEHHVKFIPIILLVVLIYTVSKVYHLPSLIFILIFGLAIGNLNELKRIKWFERFELDELNTQVTKFKELTIEIAFLVRASFFILFGYLIQTNELLNPDTLIWSGGIVFAIFFLRAIQLLISKLPLMPLLFIAPRGLITILLFLSIVPTQSIPIVNESLVIQVVIMSALLMMIGLILNRPKKSE